MESLTDDAQISGVAAQRIWHNGTVPVIFKRLAKQSLVVRLPYAEDNRVWLQGNGRRIQWHRVWKAWEVPRSRFNNCVQLVLARHGRCYVIQEYRPLETCAPACWNAIGADCECSCLGANHGSGNSLANEVSETFAFEYGGKMLACRLLTARRHIGRL
jgi:hypothetical protein